MGQDEWVEWGLIIFIFPENQQFQNKEICNGISFSIFFKKNKKKHKNAGFVNKTLA